MAGRMSPLHNPVVGLVGGQSVVPASRNGGSSNADVNGAAIDLTGGKRGVYFLLNAGALTGAANYAARLQTGDLPGDGANANWTDVNAQTFPNAAVTVKTNANTVWEMSYDPAAGGSSQVRAVLVIDANVALAGIVHTIF
jgi:hypothetical protein